MKPGIDIYHSGAFAMSAPAFVPARNEIWYTDGNTGFYVVRLTKGAFSSAPAHPAITASRAPKAQRGAGSDAVDNSTTGLAQALPPGWSPLWMCSVSPHNQR